MGIIKSKLYLVWVEMRARCRNPKHVKFKNYGLRGINICKEWNEFKVFESWAISSGYEEGLTIDRISVHGDYVPSNCRWATHEVQNWNRTDNILWNYEGKEYNTKQIARKFKLKQETLRNRRHRGWDTHRILTTPEEKSKVGKLYLYHGKEKTLTEWSKELGINLYTLSARLNKHKMSIEVAFSRPVVKTRKS